MDRARAAGRPTEFGMLNRISRFGAMPKLLDRVEIEQLSREPGFNRHLARRMRTERRRIFSLYLTELVTEFRVLEREALDRAANDPGVDPKFFDAVVRIKLRFSASVWVLRTSLWLPVNSLPGTDRILSNLIASLQPLLPKSL
jgi:hypothetical protein